MYVNRYKYVYINIYTSKYYIVDGVGLSAINSVCSRISSQNPQTLEGLFYSIWMFPRIMGFPPNHPLNNRGFP